MNRACFHLGLDERPAIDKGAVACEFNGPLTALLLYMNELKQQSHQLPNNSVGQVHLKDVIENALHQVERLYVLTTKIAATNAAISAVVPFEPAEGISDKVMSGMGTLKVLVPSEAGKKPLTKREHEVLNLISDGYSNKQGAFRMSISPRTFESHRAEIMRKLGARNTADLMRTILSQTQVAQTQVAQTQVDESPM